MAGAATIIDLIERLENPNLVVDQARCVKVRHRNASCSRCMDACPAQCIYYQNNKILFHGAECLNCMTCCTVCPTGALSPKVATDKSVFAHAKVAMTKTPGQVIFACEQLASQIQNFIEPGSVVSIKCVSSVDVSMLLYLVKEGAKTVTLVQGNCENCNLAYCLNAAQEVVDNANQLLEAWNSPGEVEAVQKIPAAARKKEDLGYDATRRGFFSDVRTGTRRAASSAGGMMIEDFVGNDEPTLISRLKVTGNGTLPIYTNPRRERLLAALDSFGTPQDVMINTGMFKQVIIDTDKCKACRFCTTFCPTGSLFKFDEGSGKIGAIQAVRNCVGCGTCAKLCLQGALTLSDEVFAMDIAEGTEERYDMHEPKAVTGSPLTTSSLFGKN